MDVYDSDRTYFYFNIFLYVSTKKKGNFYKSSMRVNWNAYLNRTLYINISTFKTFFCTTTTSLWWWLFTKQHKICMISVFVCALKFFFSLHQLEKHIKKSSQVLFSLLYGCVCVCVKCIWKKIPSMNDVSAFCVF